MADVHRYRAPVNERHAVVVDCKDEAEQTLVFQKLKAEGYSVTTRSSKVRTAEE